MASYSKVLVIGLDGATFDLILPWVKEGKLPHIGKMMTRGVWGELASVIQPVSAAAWTSFMTGNNPGKHGIFGFRKHNQGTYSESFVNGTLIKTKTLWRFLQENGKKAVVMNVPITYPPEDIDATIICGMDTPTTNSDYTRPAALKEEIRRLTNGEYKIHQHFGGYLTNDARRFKALKDILSTITVRARVAEHLIQTKPWDFCVVKFDNPDQVQHYYWKHLEDENSKFKDAILDVYIHLDDMIGRLTQYADENTAVIIVSDHGAGPYKGKVVYVNEWLRRQGLLGKGAHGHEGRTSKRSVKKMKESLLPKLVDLLYFFSSRLISYNLRDRLSMIPFPIIKTKIRSLVKFSSLDWSKTKAYVGGDLSGIHINLKGREPHGIVRPEEYENLRDDIISGLKTIMDPDDGVPVFADVLKREEIYHGPCVDEASDLVLIPRDFGYDLSRKLFNNQIESLIEHRPNPKGVTGKHRMNGVFLAQGQGVKKGFHAEGAQLIDLFPTICYLMDIPVPTDVDGRVIAEAFEADRLKGKPVVYCEQSTALETQQDEEYTDEEAEEIRQRLSGLGYIE
jgi:predicted AlkP superfamily phosphohydrolase/phosphomutase